jgi:hypothetical protein
VSVQPQAVPQLHPPMVFFSLSVRGIWAGDVLLRVWFVEISCLLCVGVPARSGEQGE